MDFNLSQSQTHWLGRVRAFIADAIVPAAAAVAAERRRRAVRPPPRWSA